MKNLKPVTAIFSLLALSSCLDKELPLYPAGEQAVVLYSIFGPGDTISVSLNYSQPLGATDRPEGAGIIRYAEVILYENDVLVDTLDYSDRIYNSTTVAVEGSTYKVVATLLNSKTLSAATRVPEHPELTFIGSETVEENTGIYEKISLKLGNTDANAIYDLRVERYSFSGAAPARSTLAISSSRPKFENLDFKIYLIKGRDIRDLNNIVELAISDPPRGSVKDSSIVTFISMVPELYQFLVENKSIEEPGLLISSGDKTFSNVENGIGIFAGIAPRKVTFVEEH